MNFIDLKVVEKFFAQIFKFLKKKLLLIILIGLTFCIFDVCDEGKKKEEE